MLLADSNPGPNWYSIGTLAFMGVTGIAGLFWGQHNLISKLFRDLTHTLIDQLRQEILKIQQHQKEFEEAYEKRHLEVEHKLQSHETHLILLSERQQRGLSGLEETKRDREEMRKDHEDLKRRFTKIEVICDRRLKPRCDPEGIKS